MSTTDQRIERVTSVSETTDSQAEAATYDVAAVEEKWQRVWAELDPFRADDAAVLGARARSATR